jgi:8-oxo-dGTP pyrophosphatase MutT (NUDIX family)
MSNWQRLGTKIVYQNLWMTVHEDNVIDLQGKPTIYGWLESPPAVFIIAIEDNGKVLLEKILRYTTGQPSWEIPAGNTDGEDPLEAAKRELEEETHLHAEKWAQISGETFPYNSVTPERNILFIARGLHKSKNPPEQADPILEVKGFAWKEIIEMIKNAEITDGQTITAIMRAGLHLGHLK